MHGPLSRTKSERYDLAAGAPRGPSPAMGIAGVIRSKPIKTTKPDTALPCPLDKVNRQFRSPAEAAQNFYKTLDQHDMAA